MKKEKGMREGNAEKESKREVREEKEFFLKKGSKESFDKRM
jgi:hypothetical protein